MLKTETNTKTIQAEVLRAARRILNRRSLQADFEHGQWWITAIDSGAQWSVCDAVPGPFCFEQVSRGDEE